MIWSLRNKFAGSGTRTGWMLLLLRSSVQSDTLFARPSRHWLQIATSTETNLLEGEHNERWNNQSSGCRVGGGCCCCCRGLIGMLEPFREEASGALRGPCFVSSAPIGRLGAASSESPLSKHIFLHLSPQRPESSPPRGPASSLPAPLCHWRGGHCCHGRWRTGRANGGSDKSIGRFDLVVVAFDFDCSFGPEDWERCRRGASGGA